jgi:uncharacterized protein
MVHYLGYTRIVSHLHITPSTKKGLSLLLILNMAAIIGYLLSRYLLSPPKTLYFLLSLSIGVGFILFMGLIVYELLHLLQRRLPFDPAKRSFFKRASDIGFLTLGSAYLGAGVAEGSKDPSVVFVDVDQNRFEGRSYRIVQISDMHIGGLIDRAFVAKSVAAINALKPDLITITGDLSDAHIDLIQEAVDELRHLKSTYGTFYVIGNHEYFHSLEDTMTHIESLGIHLLGNRSHRINDDFYILGVYDVFGFRAGHHIPDIAQAMAGINPDTPPSSSPTSPNTSIFSKDTPPRSSSAATPTEGRYGRLSIWYGSRSPTSKGSIRWERTATSTSTAVSASGALRCA